MIRTGWARASHPDFKAVIEIWLAARNDPALGEQLDPSIAQLSLLFSPSQDPKLAKAVGKRPERAAFYRLAFEAIIGLALGRATSPGGSPVDHENEVLEMLIALAREHDSNFRMNA
jgi:hypothetical protein